MKPLGITLLAVVMVFGLTPVLLAQGTTTNVRVAGQLTKIEGKALTITTTVDGVANDTVVTCNDATKFARDGDKTPVTFNDLKVGQSVRSYYNKADNVAAAVIIAAAPGTTTAK